MGNNKLTGSNESSGGKMDMGISAMASIRARIIFMAMGAIVIVGMTLIAIFSSMSSKQFKDMVVCYMDDLAGSYGKTMNLRVADPMPISWIGTESCAIIRQPARSAVRWRMRR